MKLSEFSKITGLKRTTLQLYDRKGILKPVSRTEAGYWEYDMDGVGRATLITILKECGWTLDEIGLITILKECGWTLDEIGQALSGIPDMEQLPDFRWIYTECIEKLRMKISRYNDHIRFLSTILATWDDEHLTEPVFRRIDRVKWMKKTGTVKVEMDAFGARMAGLEEEFGPADVSADPVLTKFINAFCWIGLLKDVEPPEGPTAQETLRRIFGYTRSRGEIGGVRADTASGFAEGAAAMWKSVPEKLTGIIEQNWGGEGMMDYILRALDAFGRAGEANDDREDVR